MCFHIGLRPPARGQKTRRRGAETTPGQDGDCWRTDLAPDQHGTEDDLETIEEVVSYDDDRGPARGPAFTGTDGFNAGRRSWKEETRVLGGRK